jgi:hypothetical protein
MTIFLKEQIVATDGASESQSVGVSMTQPAQRIQHALDATLFDQSGRVAGCSEAQIVSYTPNARIRRND